MMVSQGVRICTVRGCNRKIYALGLCSMHHQRVRKHGSPGSPKPILLRGLTAIERIFTRIAVRSNGCWSYTGGLTPRGYAQVKADGRMQHAHRIMYEYLCGLVPEGLELDHLCRNKSCCNPGHLEAVTHRENVIRGRAGENLKHYYNDPEHQRRAGLRRWAYR